MSKYFVSIFLGVLIGWVSAKILNGGSLAKGPKETITATPTSDLTQTVTDFVPAKQDSQRENNVQLVPRKQLMHYIMSIHPQFPITKNEKINGDLLKLFGLTEEDGEAIQGFVIGQVDRIRKTEATNSKVIVDDDDNEYIEVSLFESEGKDIRRTIRQELEDFLGDKSSIFYEMATNTPFIRDAGKAVKRYGMHYEVDELLTGEVEVTINLEAMVKYGDKFERIWRENQTLRPDGIKQLEERFGHILNFDGLHSMLNEVRELNK